MHPASECRPTVDHAMGLARRLRRDGGAALEYLWELSASVRHPRIEAFLVDGTERMTGKPVRVFYLGGYENYAFAVGRMLEDHREVERVTGINSLRSRNWLRRYLHRASMLVVDVELLYCRMLRSEPFLRIPAWVRQYYNMPDTWHEVLQSFRSNTRKTDLRKIRKYRLGYRISTLEEDFREFYHRMYVPYLEKRFQNEVIIEPEWKVLRQCRKGELMHVLREGRVVACALLHRLAGRMAYVWVGVPEEVDDGDYRGAFSALYYFTILHAYEHGCHQVDFLGSRPLLDDGLFRYKRKWGTEVKDSPVPRGDILLRPLRLDAPVRAIFERSPFIVRDGRGLAGKVLLNGDPATAHDLQDLVARFHTKGLTRLKVCSLRGFDAEALRWAEDPQAPVVLRDLSAFENPADEFCLF
jgi:hypothetical protein